MNVRFARRCSCSRDRGHFRLLRNEPENTPPSTRRVRLRGQFSRRKGLVSDNSPHTDSGLYGGLNKWVCVPVNIDLEPQKLTPRAAQSIVTACIFTFLFHVSLSLANACARACCLIVTRFGRKVTAGANRPMNSGLTTELLTARARAWKRVMNRLIPFHSQPGIPRLYFRPSCTCPPPVCPPLPVPFPFPPRPASRPRDTSTPCSH